MTYIRRVVRLRTAVVFADGVQSYCEAGRECQLAKFRQSSPSGSAMPISKRSRKPERAAY